jgi:hypothetical protein
MAKTASPFVLFGAPPLAPDTANGRHRGCER